jgi:hypothetical protein
MNEFFRAIFWSGEENNLSERKLAQK